jgi:hypothetical protein
VAEPPLKYVFEEMIEARRRRGKRLGSYLGDVKENVLEFERSSTTSHCLTKCIWKGL